MWTIENIIIIAATFVLAGFIKGVTGLGLPTVALALLTAFVGFKQALVLMLAPSLCTNIWQAFAGKAFFDIVHRQWPVFLTGSLATIGGTYFAAQINPNHLLVLLGLILCFYSVFSLTTPQLDFSKSTNRLIASIVGATTGILTGLTGTFVAPAVPYFQALKLPPAVLVQTMGIWFLIATLSLGTGLAGNGFISNDLAYASIASIAPALLGMWLGQCVRKNLPEQKFRIIFFVTLLLLGLYIAARAIIS